MTLMTGSIDIGKAFTHLFEDVDWLTKTAIGACLSLVPVLGFTVIGYELRVIRNVSKGESRPMPTWDDFGAMFMDGLQLGLARLLLALPAIALFFVPLFALFFFPVIGSIIAEGSARTSAEAERIASLAFGIGMLAATVCCGGGFLYSLALGFVYPAMTANFTRHGAFAACFNFPEILAFIRRNGTNYLTVWVAGLLAGVVYSTVFSVLYVIPCIGPLLALPLSLVGLFWIYMVTGHAVGQAMALDKEAVLRP